MTASSDASNAGPLSAVSPSEDSRIFVSFDTEHDEDLSDLLATQSEMRGAPFVVSARSERYTPDETWSRRTTERIEDADQVIVICGEHTEVAMGVFTELEIAQKMQKPYFLLWGRRNVMCTKPAGAQSTDGMYSWTVPILLDQVERLTWHRESEREANELKRPARQKVSE